MATTEGVLDQASADNVVRSATCPVLAIRPERSARDCDPQGLGEEIARRRCRHGRGSGGLP
jgi:hypothetical protein